MHSSSHGDSPIFRLSSRILGSAFLLGSLAACGGGSAPAADSSAAAPAVAAAVAEPVVPLIADGAKVYARCANCHQPTGTGTPGLYPPLIGSEIALGPPEMAIKIVLRGMQGPVTIKGKQYNNLMLPFGTSAPMTDDEVAAVMTYVRSQWGNVGAPVSAAQVAKVRAETESQKTPWTAAQLGLR